MQSVWAPEEQLELRVKKKQYDKTNHIEILRNNSPELLKQDEQILLSINYLIILN